MSLQVEYELLKALTIFLGAIQIPWGTFVGYCFGVKRYRAAFIALASQIVIYACDYLLYYRMLEILTKWK